MAENGDESEITEPDEMEPVIEDELVSEEEDNEKKSGLTAVVEGMGEEGESIRQNKSAYEIKVVSCSIINIFKTAN